MSYGTGITTKNVCGKKLKNQELMNGFQKSFKRWEFNLKNNNKIIYKMKNKLIQIKIQRKINK